MYNCTHNTNLLRIKFYLVFLLHNIVGRNMGVTWHEALRRRSSKSHIYRVTNLTKEDMWVFTYIWQEHNKNKQNRTKKLMAEYEENVNVAFIICSNLSNQVYWYKDHWWFFCIFYLNFIE